MGFNINDFLNAESRKEIKNDWKPVKVNARKLRPAPDKTNFYHAEDKEIKELAESIELIGLQQYPIIRPIEGTDEYEVIAGHKRRLAVLRLLDEGKNEYEEIPCKVETPDDIRNELILIFTNSTQRERTDYEKMREIERVRELLAEYQKTHKLTGRKQSIIAEILGTSKTKVGTLDNINNNLNAPFKEEFAAGKISTSAANEIAGLEPDAQQALYETYKETGLLTVKDVKTVKEPQETKASGQVSESDTGKYVAYEDAAVSYGMEPEREDWQQAHPESITSLCYSCKRYVDCNVKTGTCKRCDRYVNKAEAEKTEEQKYSEEQDRIDRETKKKLREMQQDEKMNKLPSDASGSGQKVHQIRVSHKYFDDAASGRKSFELLKNNQDYKTGDILKMLEFRDGRNTGRMMEAEVTYVLDGFAGLEDGYCILAIVPLDAEIGGDGHGNDEK